MKLRNQQNLFLLFFSVLYFSTGLPYIYGEPGIDPSWWVSLVMAVNKDVVFGQDFIFNYGPLGYLNTLVLPANVSPWMILLFHLFLLFNFLFIIHLSFVQTGKHWKMAALASVVILLPWGFIADTTFTLFYFLLFWLLYAKFTRQLYALFFCTVIVVLIFFIKLNLSMMAIGILTGSMIYFATARMFPVYAPAFTLISVAAAVVVFGRLLHVDLPAYVESSLQIIDAYQDAMAAMLLSTGELGILLFFELLVVVAVLYFVIRNKTAFAPNLYLYLLIAVSWFLMFKQAHTAVGHYNVFGFFLYMPPLAVLVYLFALKVGRRQTAVLFVTVLVIQLTATQFIRLSMAGYQLKEYYRFMVPSALSSEYAHPKVWLKALKYKNPFRYFSALKNYDYEENFRNESFNTMRKLPEKLLRSIGNRTVDVMPWEVSYVFFNRLNYHPRPVIQSYQANSEWLAEKNEAKYFSADAPEVVLASLGHFREQNPFWMDKGAYLALFKKYALKDTFVNEADTLFLFGRLDRNAGYLEVKELSKKTKTGAIGEELYVPTRANPICMKADIRYSLAGKIARLFFQPPYLRCEVNYSDGRKEVFRIPPSILRGGVVANRKVTTAEEFAAFNVFRGYKNPEIVSVKFLTGQAWGFQKEFSVMFEEIL